MYSSTAVVSGDEFVATFEMYFSTLSCLWYRIPTDSTTDTVEWTANISSPPDISSSLGDQAFGVNVIDASGFSVFFDPEKHQHLISEASFKNVQVWVYHLAGRLEVANIDALFYGLLDDKVTFDFSNIQFGLTQKGFEIQGAIETAIFTGSPGPIDSAAFNQPIRALLGSVGDTGTEDDTGSGGSTTYTYIHGFAPVNTSFDDSSPTTANNRRWVLGFDNAIGGPPGGSPSGGTPTANGTFLGAFVEGRHTGGVNSGTYPADFTWKSCYSLGGTYDDLGVYFNVGDRVRVRNLTSVTNYYVKIVDRIVAGINVDLQFDANVGTGNVLVTKFPTNFVALVQNGVYYELMPVRDYYVEYPASVVSGGPLELWLTSSAEANVGASTIDPSNGDYLVATIRAAGCLEPIRVTLDGGSTYTYLNGIAGRILKYLAHDMDLLDAGTYALSDLFDLQSFVDFATDYDDYHTGDFWVTDDSWFTIGLLPNEQGSAPPNHVDTLSQLLTAARAVLFYSPDELIKIKSLEASTSVGTIELEDVVAKSMRFDVDFRDIDNVIYEDFVAEVGLLGSSTVFTEHRPLNVINANNPDDGGANTSLHGATYARRVSSRPNTLRPNRKGTVTLKTTLQLVASDVGSTVTLKSKYLPGFQYDGETIHEADYVITEIKKGVDGVEITLDI
jgi:hypothetical protein